MLQYSILSNQSYQEWFWLENKITENQQKKAETIYTSFRKGLFCRIFFIYWNKAEISLINNLIKIIPVLYSKEKSTFISSVVHLIIKIVTLYCAFLFFLFISKFNQMLSFTYWVNSLAFWWNLSNSIVILTTFFQWLIVLKNWNPIHTCVIMIYIYRLSVLRLIN